MLLISGKTFSNAGFEPPTELKHASPRPSLTAPPTQISDRKLSLQTAYNESKDQLSGADNKGSQNLSVGYHPLSLSSGPWDFCCSRELNNLSTLFSEINIYLLYLFSWRLGIWVLSSVVKIEAKWVLRDSAISNSSQLVTLSFIFVYFCYFISHFHFFLHILIESFWIFLNIFTYSFFKWSFFGIWWLWW